MHEGKHSRRCRCCSQQHSQLDHVYPVYLCAMSVGARYPHCRANIYTPNTWVNTNYPPWQPVPGPRFGVRVLGTRKCWVRCLAFTMHDTKYHSHIGHSFWRSSNQERHLKEGKAIRYPPLKGPKRRPNYKLGLGAFVKPGDIPRGFIGDKTVLETLSVTLPPTLWTGTSESVSGDIEGGPRWVGTYHEQADVGPCAGRDRAG